MYICDIYVMVFLTLGHAKVAVLKRERERETDCYRWPFQ